MTTEQVISNVPEAQAPVPFDLATLEPVKIADKKILALDPRDIFVDDEKNGRRYQAGAKGIQELAQSIVKNGQLQPVVVQKNGKGYELIFGYRRTKAIMYANDTAMTEEPLTVAASVVDANDVQALAMNVAENAEREPLSPVDYAFVVKKFVDQGMAKKDIAELLGKSRAWTTEISQVGELRPAIQRKIHNGEIPYSSCRDLLGMTEEEQDERVALLEKGGTRDQMRGIKKVAKKKGKGGKTAKGKGEKEDVTNPAPTMREFKRDLESIAGLDLEEGKECKFSGRAQAVALAILNFLNGKMGIRALATKIDGAE